MSRRLQKWIGSILCCIALAVVIVPHAMADDEANDRVTVGPEGAFVADDGMRGTTELRIYIDNPVKPYEDKPAASTGGKSSSGKLPKTGDSGPDLNLVLYAALISGAGYLVCSGYGKKAARA